MPTIIAGSAAQLSVTVQSNGKPVAVAGPVSARLFTMDGRHELVASQDLAADAPGAYWPSGTVAVTLTPEQTAEIPLGDAMLILQGDFGVKRFRVSVEGLLDAVRSSLFVRDIAVDELRQDRLMAAAAGALPGVNVSDSYLWDKLRAAEAEIAHILRVPLVPTRFFPERPTAEQVAALGDMPWEIESPPDYEAQMFSEDRWGYIVTRQRPIVSVESMRFAYPSESNGYFDIPNNWLQVDQRFGHIRIVPTTNTVFTGMAGFLMMNLAGGRTIPGMVRLTYTAGLTNVERDWPDLLDVIKKLAVVKIMQDSFLPQSGSISADGISESISVDTSKYTEVIDHSLYGADGSNGGLVARLHGVRMLVM